MKRYKRNFSFSNSDGENRIDIDLDHNEQRMKEIFAIPTNQSIVLRRIFIASLQREGIILFLKGAIQTQTLEEHIIRPLMHFVPEVDRDKKEAETFVLEHVLTTTNGNLADSLQKVVDLITSGSIAIFIEGCNKAVTIEASGYSTRSVSEPSNENYVRGPKEAFVESMQENLSLIRRQLRGPDLICEEVVVGKRMPQKVSILYMKGVTELELVHQVKKKMEDIDTDIVLNLNILSQYIEERPYSLVPSTLLTERPDRVCSFLMEGHVVLLMDNSPCTLVLPVTFWSLFHTGEDQYMRLPDGNFIRFIRLISMFIALFAPSIYIAVSTFHSEMLPTDLMLAIAANRERVPFSSFFEIMLMELSFEIIREAGVRVPSIIGATIGIVGALILGQAAVDANIVSPLMVIVVAVTGLASFTIPDISLSYAIRTSRFVLTIASTLIGFFGIAIVTAYMLADMCSMKSYGVPFLSPFTPSVPSSKDFFMRPPVWKQWLRPMNITLRNIVRGNGKKGSRT